MDNNASNISNSTNATDERIERTQHNERSHHDAHTLALRQLAEWATQQALWGEALDTRDLDLAKLAKVLAECLKIRHEGERKAFAASEQTADDPDGASVAWQ